MKPINVLSLFDGMSGGQIALERAGITVANYFASEIDRYAIKVTQHHYPNTHQLGTILGWKSWQLPKIDLVIAGSPCQGFSKAGKGLNFDDPRSKLFLTFLDILNDQIEKNHKVLWMLENVKMKKEWRDYISDLLGVEPVLINSALVSAQNRERLYWANFSITQPEDKGILLKNIIEQGEVDRSKSYNIDANYWKGGNPKSYFGKGRRQLVFRVGTAADISGHDYNKRIYSTEGKSPALNTGSGGNLQPKISLVVPEATKQGYVEIEDGEGVDLTFPNSKTRRGRRRSKKSIALLTGVEFYWYENQTYRKLTPKECERLQTVKDDWTSIVSNTQRYKMLGNGWTIDTIVHIFNCSPLKTSLDRLQIDSTLPQSLPSST